MDESNNNKFCALCGRIQSVDGTRCCAEVNLSSLGATQITVDPSTSVYSGQGLTESALELLMEAVPPTDG